MLWSKVRNSGNVTMIVLNQTPQPASTDWLAFYEKIPQQGMAHSSIMCGERYPISQIYEDSWAYAAVTWSAGGEETYRLDNGRVISINPAGALTLAPGVRYDYAAGAAPFYSNMIAFPRWITDSANVEALGDGAHPQRRLETNLFHPNAGARSLMNEIAAHCRRGYSNSHWYEEKISLLYDCLLNLQDQNTAARWRIDSVKPSTSAELSKRIRRAQQFVLEAYGDTKLDLTQIAHEACLSPYHLIRVFKAQTDKTPMQYLAHIRMQAALALLQESKLTITGIAHAVGYASRASFFRAFRKYHGAAPSSVERINA